MCVFDDTTIGSPGLFCQPLTCRLPVCARDPPGALSIFKHVPHTMVTVDDLPGLVANPDFDNKTVFCLAADVPDWTTKVTSTGEVDRKWWIGM